MRSKSAPHLGSARKNSGMSSFTSAGPVVALSQASRMLQKSRSGASKRPPCRLQAPRSRQPEARRGARPAAARLHTAQPPPRGVACIAGVRQASCAAQGSMCAAAACSRDREAHRRRCAGAARTIQNMT